MFKKESFDVCLAQEKLASLEGRFKFAAGTSVDEANDTLGQVIFALKMHEAAPQFVITRALYPENGPVEDARFVVRPAAKYALGVRDMKKVFAIKADERFYDKFIKEMAIWFDEYEYFSKLDANITELNETIDNIVEAHQLGFNLSFTLGEGLLDISDTSVTVGLSDEVIRNMVRLPLFDEFSEGRRSLYSEKVVEAIKACNKPYDIVHVKTTFTKDLDIYSRKSAVKLIRKIVSRNLNFVRVGVGYVDTENYFAVIEKIPVTDAEAAALTNTYIIDNVNITSAEAKAGKTKIAISYRVSPFAPATGESIDIPLEEVIATCGA